MTTWFTADTHFGHENVIRYKALNKHCCHERPEEQGF